MKVEKLHRALAFNQSNCLTPYVQINTQKQNVAKNNFEKNFYKLMVNSALGETCEHKRNRIKVKLALYEDVMKIRLSSGLALLSLNLSK